MGIPGSTNGGLTDDSNEMCLNKSSGQGRPFTPSSLKELNTVEKAMLLSRGPYSLYGYYFTGYKMASYEALIPDNSNPGFNQTIQVYLPISDIGYVMPDDMWVNYTQWDSPNECVEGFMYGGVTDVDCSIDLFTILCESPSEN